MKKIGFKEAAPFVLLVALAIAAIFTPVLPNFDDAGKYSAADISWILVATALVFLMTPGLAFFYGGMVHRKNVISTMKCCCRRSRQRPLDRIRLQPGLWRLHRRIDRQSIDLSFLQRCQLR